MIQIHFYTETPPSKISKALAEFERQFVYPLGNQRTFRIVHSEDYSLFFRAMGKGGCLVAESNGIVLGVIGFALRDLLFPDGTIQSTLYIGDLKIDPNARGGRIFYRLAQALQERSSQVPYAYGIVMDGTNQTPLAYTGRAGLPLFEKIRKITLFRVPCSSQIVPNELPENFLTTEEEGYACYQDCTKGQYASGKSFSERRSQISAIWLKTKENSACGRLEDTRIAKRLITEEGEEIISAHLSYFAYRDQISAKRLICMAQYYAFEQDIPYFFVSIDTTEVAPFLDFFEKLQAYPASATIYGKNFEKELLWSVNTAEI